MVKINPFEKDSGFKEVTKMKHKSMGRDREDEFEKDNRRMRNGWRAFAIGVFIWGALMCVVHSLDGKWMVALRPFILFSGAIPATTLLYTSYIAGMIKYKRDNA